MCVYILFDDKSSWIFYVDCMRGEPENIRQGTFHSNKCRPRHSYFKIQMHGGRIIVHVMAENSSVS